MKVRVSTQEKWPSLLVDEDVREGQQWVNVPENLLEDLHRCDVAVLEAERAIVEHLRRTGQRIPFAFATEQERAEGLAS